MKSFSLTRRVLATVIGCQLLLTVGLTIAMVMYGRAQLRSAFDSALESRAMSVLALVRYTETHPPKLEFEDELLPPSADPAHGDLFRIGMMDGKELARSAVEIPVGTEQAGGRYADFTVGGVPYRAVLLRSVEVLDKEEDTASPPDRVSVIYATSPVEMNRQLTELGISVAGTSLFLLLAASALAAWGVRRWLEPLHDLAEQAGAISVRNWNFQPSAQAKMARELLPVTEAIETVLTRLHDSFQQQRDFTSDAAHELKTSVAILKSSLQGLLHRPRPEEEYRAGLGRLLEDCERLEELLRRLLRLARIEQWSEDRDSGKRRAVTELNSTCESAVMRIQALARASDVEIELVKQGAEAIHLRAEPEDLELVWMNLLENAVRYSPPGSKVVMRVQDSQGNVDISVEDSGPGIPAEDLPHVFDRFRRGDPSRARSTGGFGLGLAICKAFVTAYGGSIEAHRRPVQGTEMRVHLPAVYA